MKYGIISDIHGNADALQAVFNEFERLGVDRVVCLGDIIGIGPEPEKCVQMIKNLPDAIVVAGNHERFFTEGFEYAGFNSLDEQERCHHLWQHKQLSGTSRLFLLQLAERAGFYAGGTPFRVSHYAMDKNFNFLPMITPYTEEAFKKAFGARSGVYLFGHDHAPFYIKTDDCSYICVGSVGCPPEDRTIAYAGLLVSDNYHWNYHQLEVPYDVKPVISKIKEQDYPDAELICSAFFHQ